MPDKPEVYAEFDDLCKELKITYCFTLGSALGLKRDGKPIDGDPDTDLMVFCSSKKVKELKTRLMQLEYQFVGMFFNPGNEMNMHFTKWGQLLDVHFQWMDSEDHFFKMKFDKVKWIGRTFNVPHPIEEYLEFEYNHINQNKSDWKVPSDGKSRPLENQGSYSPPKTYEINENDYWDWAEKPKFTWENAKDKHFKDQE